MSGTKYPHRVLWSDATEPGSLPSSFDAAATNSAGFVDLAETPGHMIDCLPLGEANIIYKQDAIYQQQFIGGNDGFRFTRIPGDEGLLARACVVNTPKGHVFLTPDMDVRIHQGSYSESLSRGFILNWMRTTANTTNRRRSFLCVNAEKNEVLVCFQGTTVITACDTVASWNWKDPAWGLFFVDCGISRALTYGAPGLWSTSTLSSILAPNGCDLMVSSTAPSGGAQTAVGLVDQGGGSILGTPPTLIYAEKDGITLGNRSSAKMLKRSRWNIDCTAGTAYSITHGSKMTADGTLSYSLPYNYVLGTSDFANGIVKNGKYLAVNIQQSSGSGAPWKIRSVDIDVVECGTR